MFQTINKLKNAIVPTIRRHSFNMSMAKSSNGLSTRAPQDLENERIVWIDMEMTGLQIDHDRIMEVACLVTDGDLNIIAEGPDIIIHHPQSILKGMEEWCTRQHGNSGLTQACLDSSTSEEDAETLLLEFVKKYVPEKKSPLAGNSVYIDRLFLRKYMPTLDNYLHYRIIDVSTVKEICKRWNPKLSNSAPKKQFGHRALGDIKESVEELKFYKNNFFKVS